MDKAPVQERGYGGVHLRLGARMQERRERSKIGKKGRKGEEMKKSRSQKKAELVAVSERLIERLLDWEEEKERPNLTQLEDEILAIRKAFGQELLRVAIAGQESKEPVESPSCAECGAKLRNKGEKERELASRLGEMAIERGYYYCARCKAGVFPPRPTTGRERTIME
jgi:hypothetical protein